MFIRSRILSQAAAGMAVAGAVAFAPVLAPAQAQEAVKIGLILPMTGGQASTGKQIDNAVKLYMQQHGDTVAGKKVEVILKDDAAVPDNTKRLAQELIVNDKVNVLAGFGITPSALATAPIATQSKTPEVVMAAATFRRLRTMPGSASSCATFSGPYAAIFSASQSSKAAR